MNTSHGIHKLTLTKEHIKPNNECVWIYNLYLPRHRKFASLLLIKYSTSEYKKTEQLFKAFSNLQLNLWPYNDFILKSYSKIWWNSKKLLRILIKLNIRVWSFSFIFVDSVYRGSIQDFDANSEISLEKWVVFCIREWAMY